MLGFHLLEESLGRFVVQFLKTRLETTGLKQRMCHLICTEDVGARAGAKGLSVNEVAVIIVENHEVLVVGGGHCGEMAGLVRVDLAGDLVNVHEDSVGLVSDWRRFDVGVEFGLGLGWFQTRSGLVHVSIVHGNGKREVAADLGTGEVGPGCQMSSVNSVAPCWQDRGKEGGMIKGHIVGDEVCQSDGVHGGDKVGC
jgi:hypothetical protein